jgi:RNA-directed DNA polymerase
VSPVCGKIEVLNEFGSWAGVARRSRSGIRKRRTEDWRALRWKNIQRNVRRLQQRIYRAERRGDWKRVHSLQRLLLRSWSSRCLAVRQVTQENRGKRTAGVDGIASLKPRQRLKLAKRLKNLLDWKVASIRRKRIPKPGSRELRKPGIPVMADRAMQALIKQALEPEWEAKFEPNSYGFRPGRSAHDAIEAIFNAICLKPKYVLDADIEKCFDRISHETLLLKLNTLQPIMRLVRAWLKAGIVDEDETIFPEEGVPQGGVISPLLANVALHGLEETINQAAPRKHRAIVIRYADDLVILCVDLETLTKLKKVAEEWLATMGLHLKPSKTRVTHTWNEYEGNVGFDFLGFNVRQYRVGKHRTRTYRGKPGFKTIIQPSKKAIKRHHEKIGEVISQHRGAPQRALIAALNPIIRGWTQYYQTCVAKRIFSTMDYQMSHKLAQWARRRHPTKTKGWCFRRYWQWQKTRMSFSDDQNTLICYVDTPIRRHVKVKGDKSPYDGDWVYWTQRLGRDPTKSNRTISLLKQQDGQCSICGLHFTTEDAMEVHHWDENQRNNRYTNLGLLHAHCHDQVHGERYQ